MESKLATAPGIVVDPEHFDALKQMGDEDFLFHGWRRASDGLYFIDFIDRYADVQLEQLRPIIVAGLAGSMGQPNVHQKYEWLARYFNEVLEEHPASKAVAIDLSGCGSEGLV